jgi:hypothetical protein
MEHRNSVSSANRSDLTFSRVGLLPGGWAFGVGILSGGHVLSESSSS